MMGVRWSRDLDAFEGRCDACAEYFPLERDFWPVQGRGTRICRACDNLKTKARMQLRRQDATVRESDRQRSAAYYASMTLEERRALRRSDFAALDRQRRWARESMRRTRERAA